jgi:hypothetical protein
MAEGGHKSIGWVVVASAILVALFGWGFMAGVYANDVEGYRVQGVREGYRRPRVNVVGGLAAFVWTGIREIPNAPSVLSYIFTKRLWMPITVLVVEGGVLAAGFGMKKLEKSLEGPPRRRR